MGAPQVQEPINNGTPSGAPPVAPPIPAAAPAPQSASAADAPFYSSFTDPELRGYAEIRGWKAPEDVVKSHREGEKLLGGPREELVRIPKNAKPEDLAPIWNKMGRPEKPDGYQLTPVQGDEQLRAEVLPKLHEAGYTQEQVVKGLTALNEFNAKQQAAAAKLQADTVAADMVKLHQEWGPSYDERVEFADRAIRESGMSEEDILTLKAAFDKDGAPGNAKALRMLANIGEKFREAKSVFSDGGSGHNFEGKTLEGLEAQLTSMIGNGTPGTGDKMFQKRLSDNDPQALQQYNDINRRIAHAKAARQQG